MNRKLTQLWAVSLCATLTLSPATFAENEALLALFKVLRDNGTLTGGEYDLLVTTAANDAGGGAGNAATGHAPQGAPAKLDASVAAAAATTSAAAWTEKIKIKGDLRTRYQFQDEDDADDRGRGRLRYRLGVIAKPTTGWEVGAGLASGGDDQRSTNQSFDATFSTKGINLDYAYMQYAFTPTASAIAGKFPFKGYLWAPTDIMWDTDIRPEGFSARFSAYNKPGRFFASSGVWVLEENSGSSDDPYLVYGQLGQEWKSGNWFGTVAGNVYGFGDVNVVSDFTKSEGTNTDSNLSSYNLAAEIGTKVGGGKARVIGEYINNFDTDSSADTAFAIGAKFDVDRWKIKYIYAEVEANAVPDFLPDSDRFDGLTGIQGHELEIKYEIMKHVTLGLDFYHVGNTVTNADQGLVQADLNVKF